MKKKYFIIVLLISILFSCIVKKRIAIDYDLDPRLKQMDKFVNLDKGLLQGQIRDFVADKLISMKKFRITAVADSAFTDWIEFYHFDKNRLVSAGLEYSLDKFPRDYTIDDYVELDYIYKKSKGELTSYYGRPKVIPFSYDYRFFGDIETEYYDMSGVMKSKIPHKVPSEYFSSRELRRRGVKKITVKIISGFTESFVRIEFIYR